MTATATLFERWKAARGIESDRQAMRELGLSPGAAVHWKDGREAGADIIERMAKDIGDDPVKWAALAMAGQTKGEASRAWSRFARKLGAAATVAGIAIMFGAFGHDQNAIFAAFLALPFHAEPAAAVCIMRTAILAAAVIALAVWSRRGRASTALLA